VGVELVDVILSEVSQAQKDKGRHVFSHLWKADYTQIQAILYIYTYKYIQNVLPKVGQIQETGGGEKEEENDRVTISETHHVCVMIE
jgi:hypothetical protein